MFDKCDKDVVTSAHPRANTYVFRGGACMICSEPSGYRKPGGDILSWCLGDEESAWRHAAERLKKAKEG